VATEGACLPKRDNSEVLNLKLGYNISTDTIKAVLFYNHNKYVSNELVFTNTSEVDTSSILNLNGNLAISHETNSSNSY
jgi:hypothetical protein